MRGDRRLVRTWALTLLVAGVVIAFLPVFFAFIEARPGLRPWEPLLPNITPRDVSIPLFLVLYTGILVAIWRLIRTPMRLLRSCQAYVLLILLRMLAMTMLTLEPPPDLVPLHDPITQPFYPAAEPFSKDLFFSGHTATLFLLFLAVPDKRWRWSLILATVFIAAAVLVQHVHWTIDVLAAPFGAWLAWWGSGHTMRWGAKGVSGGTEAA